MALVPAGQAQPERWECEVRAPAVCDPHAFPAAQYAVAWSIAGCPKLGCIPFTGTADIVLDDSETGDEAGRSSCVFRKSVSLFCTSSMPTHAIGAFRARIELGPTPLGSGPFGDLTAWLDMDPGTQLPAATFEGTSFCYPLLEACRVAHEGTMGIACAGSDCTVDIGGVAEARGSLPFTSKSLFVQIEGLSFFPRTLCDERDTRVHISCAGSIEATIQVPEGALECADVPILVRTTLFHEGGPTSVTSQPTWPCRDADGVPGFWVL